MSCSLAQIIIVASNGVGEDTFWTQILMLVVLAVLVGIGSLIKTRASRLKEQQCYPEGIHSAHSRRRWQIKAFKELKDKYLGIFFKIARAKKIIEKPIFNIGFRYNKRENKADEGGERDLGSGMEVLDLDFLLSVVEKVEKTECCDEDDVVMRKLSFNELLRRGQLCAVDSKTLRVYAVNEGNLYSKDIQCDAMKELAGRTGLLSDYDFEVNERLQSSAMGETSAVRCS